MLTAQMLIQSRKAKENGGAIWWWYYPALPISIGCPQRDPSTVEVEISQKMLQLGYRDAVLLENLVFTVNLLKQAVNSREDENAPLYEIDVDALSEQIYQESVAFANKVSITVPAEHSMRVNISFPSCRFTLTCDEVATWNVEIMCARAALANRTAEHFVASTYADMAHVHMYHLMDRANYNTKRFVLCGESPPPSTSPELRDIWVTTPLLPPLSKGPTCPKCLQIYREQGFPDLEQMWSLLFGNRPSQ